MNEEKIKELVPDTKLVDEFGVSYMTFWRWSRDERLGFPKKIKIGSQNYRLRSEVEAYKDQLHRQGTAA